MSKTAEQIAEDAIFKSWEGKTIAPDGIIVDDYGIKITFTDGTKFFVMAAYDGSLYAEREK